MTLNKKQKILIGSGLVLATVLGTTTYFKNNNATETSVPPIESNDTTLTVDKEQLIEAIEKQNSKPLNYLSSDDSKSDEHNHDHSKGENTNISIVSGYNDLVFSELSIAASFPQTEYENTLGKIVRFSYGDYSVITDGKGQIFLVNIADNVIKNLSKNSISFKKKSEHELIFVIKNNESKYAFYYIDLNTSEPQAYKFYETTVVPYEDSYSINKEFFSIKESENKNNLIPYFITYNSLQLDLNKDLDLIVANPFFESNGSFYGYNGDKFFKYMKLNDDSHTMHSTKQDHIIYDNKKHYIINKIQNPSNTDDIYVAAETKTAEYGGIVFYNNKPLTQLTGIDLLWLDDINFIDITIDGNLVIYNTKSGVFKTISTGLDSFYVDKLSKTIYITNFYNENLLSFTYNN